MANGMLSKWWNRDDGSGEALMRAGLNMMEASGPSRTPIGFGQVAAAGGQGYLDARDAYRKRQVQDLQLEALKRKAEVIKNAPADIRRAYNLGGEPAAAKLIEAKYKRGQLNKTLGLLYPGGAAPAATATASQPAAPTWPQPGLPAPAGLPAQPAVSAAPPAVAPSPYGPTPRPFAQRVPPNMVALAMQAKDPGKALLELNKSYNVRPTAIPAEYDKRLKTWRTEVQPHIKAIEGYSDKLTTVYSLLREGTGVGDLGALNQYQRMIDDAVVRGEDVRMIQQAQGVMDILRTRLAQATEGTYFKPKMRAEIASAAKSFSDAIRQSRMGRLTGMKDMADPAIQRVWDSRVLGRHVVDKYGKPFDVPTDEASYQNKANTKTRKTDYSTKTLQELRAMAADPKTPPHILSRIREQIKKRRGGN